MNVTLATPVRWILLTALLVTVGCTKSGTNTEASTDVTSETASSAATMGQSLWDQLGGMSGANQLADAFAANLAANPTLSAALNPDAITAAKQGLVNEIAKASTTPEPYPSASLLGALSGKGLTPDAVNGVTAALSSAADSMNLSPAAKSSLMGLMAPITQSLMG